MNITDLDELVQNVRNKVIEYTGTDPFAHTGSRTTEHLYSRIIFVNSLNCIYNIIDNRILADTAKYLDQGSSNLSIMLSNIKSGKNMTPFITAISLKVIDGVKGSSYYKELLSIEKLRLLEELEEINKLIG